MKCGKIIYIYTGKCPDCGAEEVFLTQ